MRFLSHGCLFRVIVQAVLAFAKRWVYDGQEKFSLRRIFPLFFFSTVVHLGWIQIGFWGVWEMGFDITELPRTGF